ncbi:MAG: DUF3096 domain-containing protein [Neomegalonema sp.]|nr:DUF3096 domain-containing protein [Neomegalonema sp.]
MFDVAGIPLLPILALLGGLIVLFKRDFLEYVVGLFLIGFGVIGLLTHFGVIESDFLAKQQEKLEMQIEEMRQQQSNN